MTSVLTLDERAAALRDDLEQHPTVDSTSIATDRRPHRVDAILRSDSIPEGVRDIIEAHQAHIEDAHVQAPQEDGGLLVALVPQVEWKPAGQRTVRAHGGSIVVTLTREALEASGLREDDEVNLEAREGQVQFTRRDD